MSGFINMEVLKPIETGNEYLIISHWETVEKFQVWTKSQEFLDGHKRGFDDIITFKKKGKQLPVKSVFKTYKVIAE